MSALPAGLVASVREELITEPDATGAADDPTRLHTAVRRRSGGLGPAAALELLRAVEAELIGAGPLAGLLSDPGVTDILVNGPAEVWVERGGGLDRVALAFTGEEEVRRLAVRLASAAGRRLDTGVPFVDARLPGGVRLHAVLAPVAVDGTCISLRLHRHHPLDVDELVRSGSLAKGVAEVLEAMMAARLAFLVSGGAGTGKTTLLGALLARAGANERLLIVEDAAELVVNHPHLVRLEARPPNVEGAGEITLRDLVRQALRMRPDRLIVGEIRGQEVLDMLLAGNTGHDGGITTVHANGVGDVPARVEALAMLAGVGRMAAHSLLASAMCAAVQLRRAASGFRWVAEIAVLERNEDDLVRPRIAVTCSEGDPSPRRGPGAASLAALLDERSVPVPELLAAR